MNLLEMFTFRTLFLEYFKLAKIIFGQVIESVKDERTL